MLIRDGLVIKVKSVYIRNRYHSLVVVSWQTYKTQRVIEAIYNPC